MAAWQTQLRKGITELAALALLQRGEAYGYELVERLSTIEGMELSESTIYPLLAHLAREGRLSVRSAPSEIGPPRRYYSLTEAGRLRLAEMAAHWRKTSAGLAGLLDEGEKR
jgi:PadR family transcriptional regulator PadR